jgi:hypothetical protein
MKITPVDSQNNLFKIIDILPPDIVNLVIKQDWLAFPWDLTVMQEDWPRRRIYADIVVPEFNQYLKENTNKISEAIGVSLDDKSVHTIFWVDGPGIEHKVTPHLDNKGIKVVMQAYWSEPNAGTSFFNDEEGKSIRFSAPHINNTGYILINHSTAWHGMIDSVTTARVSSYTFFNFID